MKKITSIVASVALTVSMLLNVVPKVTIQADNPLAQNVYTADPAPMVHDGTLYLYTSHDKDGSDYFYMPDWQCYSTTDMQNWTHHGTVLSDTDFSYAEKDNNTYITVAMGGPTKDENGNYIDKNMAMIDTKNIYLWAFQNLKSVKLFPANFPVKEIKLGLVKSSDKLLLSPQNDFYLNLPSNVSKDDISISCDVPESIDAPIEAGKVLGRAYVYYKGERVGSFNLISTQTFKKNYFLLVARWLDSIFSSPIFIFFVTAFVIFLILYIRVCVVRYKNKKRKNKIKKFTRNIKG